jgi:hypothetical protein
MSVTRACVSPCTTLALIMLAAPVAAQQQVPLPARDNPLHERPATVFNVGAEEGENWEMFSGIRALAFDKADNLYVLDGQNFRVLVFDARGKFVRQFGKKGGGPGELQAPLGLAVMTDGNIAVTDLANRGYVIYKPDGTYVRNVTFPTDHGMPMGRIEAETKGGVVVRANRRMAPDAETSGPNYTAFLRQPLTAAENGAAPEPTQLYRVEIPQPRVTDQGQGRRVVMMVPPGFGAQPVFGVLPDGGLAVHHETEYAIKLLDPSGRHTRTLTRAFTPKKVTKKDQEAELERRRTARANPSGGTISVMVGDGAGRSGVSIGAPGARPGGPGGQPPQLNLEDIPFAEYMSVVTNLRTDPLGRIWVQRRHQDGSNVGAIDLITVAGKYIGTLPAQPLPDAVSASGLAAYIVRDDLGVERVSVRRLPANWR